VVSDGAVTPEEVVEEEEPGFLTEAWTHIKEAELFGLFVWQILLVVLIALLILIIICICCCKAASKESERSQENAKFGR